MLSSNINSLSANVYSTTDIAQWYSNANVYQVENKTYNGPSVQLVGGSNPDSTNWSQLQWCEDINNPNEGQNNYAWVDGTGFTIQTYNESDYNYVWNFQNDGNVSLPGGGKISIGAFQNSAQLVGGVGGYGSLSDSAVNNYIYCNETSGVTIATNYNFGGPIWNFAMTGVTTVPGDVNVTGTVTATGPMQVGTFTIAQLAGILGNGGQMVAVTDSPTIAGRIAFWDLTNQRWSYVSDNSAVVV
jgi:hypothetical protein